MFPRRLYLATPIALLASLAGQRVELPIHDLVHTDRLVPNLDEDENADLFPMWIHRQYRIQREDPSVMGEARLLGDRRVKPWFTAGGLQTILGRLTQLDEARFEVEGRRLLVYREDAAATRAGLAQLRRQLPPQVQLRIKLERQNKAKTHVLMHLEQEVQAGRTETFEDLISRRSLKDFEVEIAQSASASNPVIGALATGTCLAVRSRIVPGKGELLIEVFARVAQDVVTTPIATLHQGTRTIDRASRQLDECGFAMRVPRGATRRMTWTAANGDQLVLTCSGTWRDPQPGPQRGTMVRCRGLFHKPVVEFQSDSLEPEEGPAPFPVLAAFKHAGAEAVQVVEDDEAATAALLASGTKAEQIDANIAAQLARSIRSAGLQITLLDLAAGTKLSDEILAGPALARIRCPVIAGKSVAYSGRTEMRFLRDWDIEVAQSARIPDPKVDVLRHGYFVDARVREDLQGRISSVALNAKVVRLLRMEVVRATISQASQAGGISDKKGSISPAIVLPRDEVGIEIPSLQQHSVSTVLRLDASGSAVLRRAAPQLLGEGRELLIVVKVEQ